MSKKLFFHVEDDADDCTIFSEALFQLNPDAILISEMEAESALKKLRDKKNLPHVIFLDLMMPGMDGLEFIIQLKRDTILRRIPLVVYSEIDNMGEVEKIRKLGVADFFKKTSDIDALKLVLSKYVL